MLDPVQNRLPLFPSPASRTGAYSPAEFFLAVRPDQSALEEIDAVAAPLAESDAGHGSPIGKRRYHLTLHGNYPSLEDRETSSAG